jgi:ubiquitin-like 1-activating enzyme E1 B
VDARRHVNRLCLAAGVLLIDSGTTGYVGQVSSIKKGVTACYDCKPKPTQKVFPICTIRSTPDKPVHCIVWAKECFKLLLGNTVESMLYEDPALGEPSTFMEYVSIPYEGDVEVVLTRGISLLRALYSTEVTKKIASDTYKNAVREPEPLPEEDIAAAAYAARSRVSAEGAGLKNEVGDGSALLSRVEAGTRFLLCLVEFYAQHSAKVGALEFDKDFSLAMQFVYAAASLRSSIFGIEQLSAHDTKGVAGNIIPAIATTNAIVAGIQVLQAMKMLGGGHDFRTTCPHTYCLRSRTRKGLYLQPTQPDEPDSGCFACNASLQVLEIDVELATLEDLVTLVAKGRLGMACPSVYIGHSCIYEVCSSVSCLAQSR